MPQPALLVLGSKPDPCIPSSEQFSAVACANASGFSARRHNLPTPQFTVISSILFSGKNESNRLALQALQGLRTERLYLFPRRPFRKKPWKQLLHINMLLRGTPLLATRQLRRLGYHFDACVAYPESAFLRMALDVAGDDPHLRQLLARKVPSVGVLAVILGIAEYGYAKVVLSGISFQITHAYALNPLIAERGSVESRHAETDIHVLAAINQRHHNLFTTEPILHARTGIPLL